MNRQSANHLIEIARLYYRENLSQQQIADRLSLSRPTVSNALKRCRAEGIVEIRIRAPDSPAVELAGALASRWGLAHARVVDPGPDEAARRRHMGHAAAVYLTSQLGPTTRIGLSWGTTLYEVVEQLALSPHPGATVAQLIGALGAGNPCCDGFELARRLAEKLGGRYSVIQAPAIVGSAALKRLLVREPAIRDALRAAARCEIALTGISADEPAHNALVRAGYLDPAEAEALCRQGAVGHACGWHFDAAGRLLDTALHARVVGLPLAELRRIPCVIGVAGGPEKVTAIAGALRGGFLDVLVTDTTTARAVLDLAEAAGPRPRRQPQGAR